MNFETLTIIDAGPVRRIELARPDKANAFNARMWQELQAAFEALSADPGARVGVLAAQGKNFSAGIDFEFLLALKTEIGALPPGRQQERLRERIVELQAAVSAIEACRKPVLAAIHGACLGGGVDVICACDLRYAARETRFSVKEVDLAIVADLGSLQRLPRLVGEGLARELAYTGREFSAEEAREMRLVNRVFPDKDSLLEAVMALAAEIAGKSPLTVRGIKETLNYSRDHSVAAGLSFVAARNAASLFSRDIEEALSAALSRRPAHYED